MLLERGEVKPCALAADQPVGEFEDMQEADAYRPVAAIEAKHLTRGSRVQDGLVDDAVLADQAAHSFEPRDLQADQ